MPQIYTYQQLCEKLPVRTPLLMLDQAELSDDGLSGVGIKQVSINETVFAGHFPGQPILPGVLQIGAMVQLSRLIYETAIPAAGGSSIVLKQLKRVKFRKPIFPGMSVRVQSQLTERTPEGDAVFTVSCTTESGVASSGTLTLSKVRTSEYDPVRKVLDRPESPYAGQLAELPPFGVLDLMKILPHRPPFLLIDHAVGIGADGLDVYGYKNITGNDILLEGTTTCHFPSYLMIEAGAQLGCAHVLSKPGNEGKLGIFLSLDEANFYHHVLPGDRLTIHAKCEGSGRSGFASGDFWVDDLKICDCQMKFVIVEKML